MSLAERWPQSGGLDMAMAGYGIGPSPVQLPARPLCSCTARPGHDALHRVGQTDIRQRQQDNSLRKVLAGLFQSRAPHAPEILEVSVVSLAPS